MGLGTADITALKTKNADYSGKLNASLAKQAEAQSTVKLKNQYKDAIEDTVQQWFVKCKQNRVFRIV